MTESDLLTVKEALLLYDPEMNLEVFRRARVRKVVRRKIKIIRAALDALIEEERGKVG